LREILSCVPGVRAADLVAAFEEETEAASRPA
jgi:hypothetical protein